MLVEQDFNALHNICLLNCVHICVSKGIATLLIEDNLKTSQPWKMEEEGELLGQLA